MAKKSSRKSKTSKPAKPSGDGDKLLHKIPSGFDSAVITEAKWASLEDFYVKGDGERIAKTKLPSEKSVQAKKKKDKSKVGDRSRRIKPSDEATVIVMGATDFPANNQTQSVNKPTTTTRETSRKPADKSSIGSKLDDLIRQQARMCQAKSRVVSHINGNSNSKKSVVVKSTLQQQQVASKTSVTSHSSKDVSGSVADEKANQSPVQPAKTNSPAGPVVYNNNKSNPKKKSGCCTIL